MSSLFRAALGYHDPLAATAACLRQQSPKAYVQEHCIVERENISVTPFLGRPADHALDAAPKIEFKFLETAYDVEAMLFGARFCRKLAEQPALKPYIAEETVPGPLVTSEEDLIDLRNRGVSNLYPACRMGRIRRRVNLSSKGKQ